MAPLSYSRGLSEGSNMRTRSLAGLLAFLLAVSAVVPALAAADGRPSPLSTASSRLGDRVLGIGMSGEDVRQLQQLLNKRGFHIGVDGQFGPQTLGAVKRAQAAYGLVVDGYVGPITLGALRHGNPPKTHRSSHKCSSSPGSGDYVTRWRPVIKCVLKMLHQSTSTSTVNNVLIVIRYESGGNPRARNGTDVNAMNGDPSRGLMQTIGATFNAYRSSKLSKSIYDPAANIYAGLNYAIHRYGSISNIPGVRAIHAGLGYVPYKRIHP